MYMYMYAQLGNYYDCNILSIVFVHLFFCICIIFVNDWTIHSKNKLIGTYEFSIKKSDQILNIESLHILLHSDQIWIRFWIAIS